jgi:HD-GYP domain-containing protein (c-di-GMP phosphodiesterase class II)
LWSAMASTTLRLLPRLRSRSRHLQHHERLNGSGYPRGLGGEAILAEAKVLAVAEVVDSMMARRPYREKLGIDAALHEIEAGKGKLYDPAAVDACILLFRQKAFSFE